jgi:hypothetical protein
LLIVAINPQVLLECAVQLFNLTVGGGAMSGGEVETHAKERAEGSEEVRCEFGAAVGRDVEGDAVLGEDMGNEGVSDIYGGSGVCSRNEYAFLAEAIDNHQNGGETV